MPGLRDVRPESPYYSPPPTADVTTTAPLDLERLALLRALLLTYTHAAAQVQYHMPTVLHPLHSPCVHVLLTDKSGCGTLKGLACIMCLLQHHVSL